MIRILTGILLLSLSSCASIKSYNLKTKIVTDPGDTIDHFEVFYRKDKVHYLPGIFIGGAVYGNF